MTAQWHTREGEKRPGNQAKTTPGVMGTLSLHVFFFLGSTQNNLCVQIHFQILAQAVTVPLDTDSNFSIEKNITYFIFLAQSFF